MNSYDISHSYMGLWNKNDETLYVFHSDFYQRRLNMNQTSLIALSPVNIQKNLNQDLNEIFCSEWYTKKKFIFVIGRNGSSFRDYSNN